MAAAEKANKTKEEVIEEMFKKALPDLRETLESLPRSAQSSWHEHMVHATVGLGVDLGKYTPSKDVERMMLKEVFVTAMKRKKGFTNAFYELIPIWEMKRGKRRAPPRARRKENALWLEKPKPSGRKPPERPHAK